MFKTIIHIILIFSIFISSGGVWINSFYCQNKLVKKTLFLKSESCCERSTYTSCYSNKMNCFKEGHEEKEGCCDSKTAYFKLDQDQQIVNSGIDHLPSYSVDMNLVIFHKVEFKTLNHQGFKFFNYVPPDIKYDPQIILQTFLL